LTRAKAGVGAVTFDTPSDAICADLYAARPRVIVAGQPALTGHLMFTAG
jgi:hypothetical protein